LKAAGKRQRQRAEVNIRNIRVKVRKTKAGVREKYKYLPPNQFNMDLCLDGIQVMNRMPKMNQDKALMNYSLAGKLIIYVISGLNGVNQLSSRNREESHLI